MFNSVNYLQHTLRNSYDLGRLAQQHQIVIDMQTEENAQLHNKSRLLRLAQRIREVEQAEHDNVLTQKEEFQRRLEELQEKASKSLPEAEVKLAQMRGQLERVGARLHQHQLLVEQDNERNRSHVSELKDIEQGWLEQQRQATQEFLIHHRTSANSKISEIQQDFKQKLVQQQRHLNTECWRTNSQADQLIRRIDQTNSQNSNARISQTVNTQLDRFTVALVKEEQSRIQESETLRLTIEQTHETLLSQIDRERNQREEIQANIWALLEKACDKLHSKLK